MMPVPFLNTHPTIALDPIICPLVENPMPTQEYMFGAESRKFHKSGPATAYCKGVSSER